MTWNQAQPSRQDRDEVRSVGLAKGCNRSRRNRTPTQELTPAGEHLRSLSPSFRLRIKFSDSPIKFLRLGANVGNQRRNRALRTSTVPVASMTQLLELALGCGTTMPRSSRIARNWVIRAVRSPTRPFSGSVECLHIELVLCLHLNKTHRWARRLINNSLRVTMVALA